MPKHALLSKENRSVKKTHFLLGTNVTNGAHAPFINSFNVDLADFENAVTLVKKRTLELRNRSTNFTKFTLELGVDFFGQR